MNARALSWFWFVPPLVTIAAGVWVSTGGTHLADNLTQEARAWQDQRSVEAGILMDAALTTDRLSVAAKGTDGKIRLVAGTPADNPGKGAPVTGNQLLVAAGDTVNRPIDVTISSGATFAKVYLSTEVAENNALTNALRVKVASCTTDWVVEKQTAPTCPGESEVLVGDVPLVGNTVTVIDHDGVKPGKTHHLLLELRVPSDAGNSAAGQEADLTLRFDGA